MEAHGIGDGIAGEPDQAPVLDEGLAIGLPEKRHAAAGGGGMKDEIVIGEAAIVRARAIALAVRGQPDAPGIQVGVESSRRAGRSETAGGRVEGLLKLRAFGAGDGRLDATAWVI